MVLKSIKHGVKVYGPPYTKAEEREFYSRNARGPVTVARPAADKTKTTNKKSAKKRSDKTRP
jgi:hypothetical protein